MGNSLLQYYREKVKRTWKIAFLGAFLIGIAVHLYKFTNTLLNHDSLYNIYSNQDVTASGRWFLSVACGLSSYFDLPWINGIFSLIWIALTVVVIVDLFRVENPVIILLIGGLMVTFPSVTETFFFEFTADGYMLAMLFATLAVRITPLGRCTIPRMAISVCLICLCCAIYQAYVSFALLLLLCHFIYETLENRYTTKELLIYIAKQVGVYVVALIGFYAIWKIVVAVGGVTVNEYQGIGQLADMSGFDLSLSGIFMAMMSSIRSMVFFFFEWNILEHGITLYGVLNVFSFCAFVLVLIISLVKSRLFHEKGKLLLVLLALILCIPLATVWRFVTAEIVYRPMMLQCWCLLYILTALLCERWVKAKLADGVALLLAIIIANNAISANIAYFYMHRCYEQTYATGVEMVVRMRQVEGDTPFEKVAVVGDRALTVSLGNDIPHSHIHMLASGLETDLLFTRVQVEMFLTSVLDVDQTFATYQECEDLEKTTQVQEMESWPSPESMQVMDEILIIKFGE